MQQTASSTTNNATELQLQPCSDIAKPLHLQRLEAALDMRPFMAFARKMLAQPLSSGTDSEENEHANVKQNADSDDSQQRRQHKHTLRLLGSKEDRQYTKMQLYNFNDLTSDREWLYNLLMSDTDSDTEISDEDDYVKEMLKNHVREKKLRENFYKKPKNSQYAYYGAGLLSNHDMYPEHQQSIVGVRKRRRRTKKEKPIKLPRQAKPMKQLKQRKVRKKHLAFEQPEPGEIHPSELKNYAFGDTIVDNDDDDDDECSDELDGLENASSSTVNVDGVKRKQRKSTHRTPEVMAARRRRVWQIMAKKEVGRYQRAKFNNHKEMVQNCKRVATMCAKVVRQRAILSQKVMKETVWRAKRLTREMLAYWKRYERVERDTRRRLEKEAEEQRKMDVELIEAKRQQRKLNFLITQTELYAHFMSKKLGQGSEEEQLRILNQLDEDVNPRLAAYDDYDAEHMKLLAQQNAEAAFDAERNKTRQFDVAAKIKQEKAEELAAAAVAAVKTEERADLPQPKIFQGTLKTYQIKGMTWLANLYDQGISGILADEMGLGKTVQSIAFLCHIAEHYGVWGPFLIISPASTLHNWQQEMQRFVPDFNVVPYWGSPNERKILRQFWEQKDLHTREASFHVVITSYQLVVSDYKYFNRIKWQYMVLDEAQAIKSASSMRWKLLLGFNCRNRLLLSGTPIQNSMAELWALLHFIMPTLFDSHDEFNEWFSKDIESHAENKTGIDEKQISRLHMILKPFMLRRIKKDVENELSDKIEIMVYCPLTIRQKLLYMALKKKIRIEDLLHLTGAGQGDGHHIDRNFTSNLMNLVMQFRKVCNHPELFERRDVKSAFAMRCKEYVMPRLVYDEALLYKCIPSKRHWLYNRFSIFKAAHVREVYNAENKDCAQRYVDLNISNSCFSLTRFCDLSLKDIEDTTINGLITFFLHYRRKLAQQQLLRYRQQWWTHYKPSRYQLLEPTLSNPLLESNILQQFIFTGMTSEESSIYAFGDYTLNSMQETMEHRMIRLKHAKPAEKSVLLQEMDDVKVHIKMENDDEKSQESQEAEKSLADEADDALLFKYKPRAPRLFTCEALQMPRFLYGLAPRVQAVKRRAYCNSRAAEWSYIRHVHCENPIGLELMNTGLELCKPRAGWSSIIIPDKQTLVSDAGKLAVLDSLLTRLKKEGHRVLIYSQMTKMIDLLEEYMWHRKHRYMRLDGSSKISARRDMVADFQTRADIFVFLLSTRAGGLGINLTAADTVIFYDSDWNPTVDQQAMDRAHRLGQTKQVTVYRLICKGTIEERILQRAREKSEIQRMVISGGNFKPDTLKPKEVVSLLLDDEEIELKYRQKTETSNEPAASAMQSKDALKADRKRAQKHSTAASHITKADSLDDNAPAQKRIKQEFSQDDDSNFDVSHANSETFVPGATAVLHNDDSDNENVIVDCEGSSLHGSDSPMFFAEFGSIAPIRRRHHPRGTKRGRPRGSTRRAAGNGSYTRSLSSPIAGQTADSNLTTDDQLQQEQQTFVDSSSFASTVPLPMRRGPGRPRIKTGGPINTGLRGAPRTRKPIGPLVVPLGRSPAATPLNRSPAISPAPSPAHVSAANRSPFPVAASTSAAAENSAIAGNNSIKDI